ncbi:hypothetical protein [Promicromonospora soli]|uniref:Uncharacterized protein n=1 Tax=Promicromonospora soli TaxID=2035533 RepID=A0A919G427_9MICO|nr:hypothetical protein [Promicromonospora soli]GHH76785.1 hypothetical protein GCM10017772_36300 [Promicromonospora soli]
MNEHERLGDPAFDRLVAADPAKRAPDPVEGVLRAKVDALIAGSGTRPLAEVRAPSEQAGPEGREPAGPGQADELAVRRHRRRAPWLVAAAVAGIVAAGGGGYVAGESGAGAGSMAADVEDSGGAESADNAEPSTMGLPEADAEAAEPLEAGGDLPAGAGLVFHAGAGLSDTPRTAEVRSAGAGGSESLGAYPVVSEVEAVERLGDPRFAGSVLGSRPAPQEAEQARPTAEAPVPGGPIAWPVADVTIVSASLTEVRYSLADDTELLVPAYHLVDDKGNSWTVMAVGEELLDFAP